MRCFKHGCMCPSYPTEFEREGRVILAIGGNTCTPWSSMGQRRGWVHEVTLCFGISLISHASGCRQLTGMPWLGGVWKSLGVSCRSFYDFPLYHVRLLAVRAGARAGGGMAGLSLKPFEVGVLSVKASLCFLLWARELMQYRPHLVVQECTKNFDADLFEEMLSELYTVCVVMTDPCEQGHAVRRPRKYCILALKSSSFSVSWNAESYRRIAVDSPLGGASMYFVASSTSQMTFRKQLAKTRHIPATLSGVAVPWVSLLSCGVQRRLDRYVAVIKQCAKRHRFVVVNLTQEPKFAGAPCDCIPSLLRRSMLYGWEVTEGIRGRHARLLLPLEYLVVQGLPVHSRQHPHFQHVSRALTRSDLLSDSDLRSVAGNGMNAAQVGVALLFAVCASRYGCSGLP